MPRCNTSIQAHCADPELYSCRQVVDTKDHKTAKSKLVDMANIGAPGTDVATCVTADERLLAVATIGSAGKQSPGRVLLYSVGTDGKLTAIRTLTTSIGCLPDQIKWTKDCRTLIAAIEGEAGTVTTTNPPSLSKLPCLCYHRRARECVSSVSLFICSVVVPCDLGTVKTFSRVRLFVSQSYANSSLDFDDVFECADNPYGGVAVVKFTKKVADDTAATFNFYDFQTYVTANSAAMLADGVRWSLRPETKTVFSENDLNVVIADNQATFARDLEPEYLALSEDGKTVWVALQEASAIATFDLSTNTFTNIKALKPK